MKPSHIVALVFWVALLAGSIVEVELELAWTQTTGFDALMTFAVAGLALGWVLADANENRVQIPGALKVAVFALALVAVPYYRFKYFGVRRGLQFIVVIVLLFGATLLLSSGIGILIRPDYV